MDIESRCNALKEKIAAELQQSLDQREKGEVLIAALYEMSRTIIHELGRPMKTREYQEEQGAVLELIGFIAIPLVRNADGDTRGVAVLTEIAHGCDDPMLQKKLSVYAQELLAKSQAAQQGRESRGGKRLGWPALAGVVAVALALYLVVPVSLPPRQPVVPNAPPAVRGKVPLAYHTPGPQAAPAPPLPASPGPLRREGNVPETVQAPAYEPKKEEGAGELTTKVRIANNQILVPVVLKNGGETVRAELVLDTGSTHTSIHEGLAGKLRIDLRSAKWGQAEAADGRTIYSRSVSIDSLGVGPFKKTPAEIDLITYQGTQGFHDGLLGMDFLGRHRYQIDMEHEMIRWY